MQLLYGFLSLTVIFLILNQDLSLKISWKTKKKKLPSKNSSRKNLFHIDQILFLSMLFKIKSFIIWEERIIEKDFKNSKETNLLRNSFISWTNQETMTELFFMGKNADLFSVSYRSYNSDSIIFIIVDSGSDIYHSSLERILVWLVLSSSRQHIQKNIRDLSKNYQLTNHKDNHKTKIPNAKGFFHCPSSSSTNSLTIKKILIHYISPIIPYL